MLFNNMYNSIYLNIESFAETTTERVSETENKKIEFESTDESNFSESVGGSNEATSSGGMSQEDLDARLQAFTTSTTGSNSNDTQESGYTSTSEKTTVVEESGKTTVNGVEVDNGSSNGSSNDNTSTTTTTTTTNDSDDSKNETTEIILIILFVFLALVLITSFIYSYYTDDYKIDTIPTTTINTISTPNPQFLPPQPPLPSENLDREL